MNNPELFLLNSLQPRRIVAMSIAERVAWERGETLGKSVGYQVYFCGINKTVVVDHNLTFFLPSFDPRSCLVLIIDLAILESLVIIS